MPSTGENIHGMPAALVHSAADDPTASAAAGSKEAAQPVLWGKMGAPVT